MLHALWNDEFGVIISAELVFIATILVIGLVVGLTEVQHAIVSELDDIGNSIGSINQSYHYSGFSSRKADGSYKGMVSGSSYSDSRDECDNASCAASDLGCDAPMMEKMAGHNPD